MLRGQAQQPFPVPPPVALSQPVRSVPRAQPEGGSVQPARSGVRLLTGALHTVVSGRQELSHPHLQDHTGNAGPLPHRQPGGEEDRAGGEALN